MSLSTVPEHCDPTSPFLAAISSTFHSCVPTSLALVSTSLGILSIVSWLFAQLPQLIKNYKLKSASGLSIYFLAEWFLGDLTNLMGALLTRQAAWQVVVAAYYVTVDVCLVVQYFWYSQYKPWREKRSSATGLGFRDQRIGASTEPLMGIAPARSAGGSGRKAPAVGTNNYGQPESRTEPKSIGKSLFRNLNYFGSPIEKATPDSSYRNVRRPYGSPSPGVSPNTLLLISFLFAVLAKASPVDSYTQHPASSTADETDTVETAGRILSWMSTLLYLGSRLPQIYKNYKRRSTAGLSPTLFIAAFFGNLFYSSSLLTNPLAWDDSPPYGLHGWVGNEGSNRMTWICLALPFFLGAAGVLAMDAIVGTQFLIFGEKGALEAPVKVVVVQDERGRSHWRKVSGWMRGWVPSPSPRRGAGGEDGRLLRGNNFLGREQSYGTV